MLRMTAAESPDSHPRSGLSRRDILQVGYSGLVGMGLSTLLAPRRSDAETRSTPVPRAKAVLLIFLTGGPCQLETFDPKPDAPSEVRGPFGTIATKLAGVRFADLLPEMAARADRFAVIRTMAYPDLPGASHEVATPLILAGLDLLPAGVSESDARRLWPCYSGALDYFRPRRDGLPSGMVIPKALRFVDGEALGSDAGLLGPRYDPWKLDCNPNGPAFGPETVGLSVGLAGSRTRDRRTLLERFDDWRRGAADEATTGRFDTQRRRAFDLLDAGRFANAFALQREDPRLRDRYGRHIYGQTLLLARRLIQAGIPLIQANMGAQADWDFHMHNKRRAESLTPPLDRAFSALLDDLEATGLLNDVLVILTGEFGRTPRMNKDGDGREHWTKAFCTVIAGAGVRGGQVIGRTDRFAASCATHMYRPSDIGATIYTALGLDPAAEIRDQQGRPLQLNRGEVISPLYS
jgi:Protein of unknown function (DUF1501)